jgi:hypothetical protein
MMAEMIATYNAPRASAGVANAAPDPAGPSAGAPAQEMPDAVNGGYLNEVRSH